MKSFPKLLSFVSATWLLATSAWAAPQAPAPMVMALQTAVPIVIGVLEPTPETKPIALEVADWSLSQVLSALSQQAGINVVLVSEKNPKVTLRLDHTPFEEVLKVLSSLTDMSVVRIRSGYVMGPRETVKTSFPKEYEAAYGPDPKSGNSLSDDFIIDLYQCQHVEPAQLANSLGSIFKDSKLAVSVGPGKLMPQAVDGSGASGNQGNSGTGTGSTGSAGGQSGSMGSGSAPPNPGAGSASGEFTNSANNSGRMLILRGPRAVVTQAMALAAKLDSRQRQISIEVEILDVSNDALKDLGISWPGSTGTRIEEANPRGMNFGSFNRSALKFDAILRHLESTEKAKVLAKPNLSLLDQERGYILIGDRINFPVVISTDDNGDPVFDIREERVGIYLQVSGTVNQNGDITLNLYPQVSTVTGFLEVNGGSYPQISTREARSSLRTRSGETIVMGGLIRDEEIKMVERVPILGRIPIFGELFTRRKTTRNSSQVMIFITPRIIDEEAKTSPTTPTVPEQKEEIKVSEPERDTELDAQFDNVPRLPEVKRASVGSRLKKADLKVGGTAKPAPLTGTIGKPAPKPAAKPKESEVVRPMTIRSKDIRLLPAVGSDTPEAPRPVSTAEESDPAVPTPQTTQLGVDVVTR